MSIKYQQLTLKIFIFILLIFFIAELILLPKAQYSMLSQANEQEIITVQRICGAILENSPELEEEFVLGIRSSNDEWMESGRQILAKYGYDTNHLLEDDTIYQSYLGIWKKWTLGFLITTVFLIFLLVIYLNLFLQSQTQKIIRVLGEYLSEDFSFATSQKPLSLSKTEYSTNQIGDILKQLGNQIRVKNARLYKEKESTQELVTDISHQLKTPLAALKTCFFMYLDASNQSEQEEFLQRSQLQLEKLENLTENLMNISRLETAMIDLSPQSVELQEILISAVNGVYEKARKKQIEIELQPMEEIILQIDPKWTTEAVINVLDNAIKYSPERSSITIDVKRYPIYTRMEIKDKGIGIKKEEYNQIFGRFYRSNDKMVKETEGSGVGLYLTRMILERQSGNIFVQSVIGQGSTFILQFKNS